MKILHDPADNIAPQEGSSEPQELVGLTFGLADAATVTATVDPGCKGQPPSSSSIPHENNSVRKLAADDDAWMPLDNAKPGGTGAIVRVLRSASNRPGILGDKQVMIITPSRMGADGAIVPLHNASRAAGGIAVHLHVIEGCAALVLRSRHSHTLLAERQENPGDPCTRIDLDLHDPADEDIELVIRNAASGGRTTMLLHGVQQIPGATSP